LRLRQNIDVHQHIFPPAYLAAAREAGRITDVGEQPAVLNWAPHRALARMDELGIGLAYTSISTPGVWWGNDARGRRLARTCNEYAAGLVREYPRRFGMFASVPVPDVDGSLVEIAYAFDTLHADGVVVLTNYGDRWIGDPLYEPVLAELNRRNAVVFVHPTVCTQCRDLLPNVPFTTVEYPLDTTRAVVSLLFNGAFTRFPSIRFIFAHGGGALPMVADRITRIASARSDLAFPEPPLSLLKKQYYDVALSVSAPALAGIMALAEPERILFGTDHPFVEMGYTTDGLRRAGLDAVRLAAIECENADRLFSGQLRA
jgi:6-methylsalicylate decarboxylase